MPKALISSAVHASDRQRFLCDKGSFTNQTTSLLSVPTGHVAVRRAISFLQSSRCEGDLAAIRTKGSSHLLHHIKSCAENEDDWGCARDDFERKRKRGRFMSKNSRS